MPTVRALPSWALTLEAGRLEESVLRPHEAANDPRELGRVCASIRLRIPEARKMVFDLNPADDFPAGSGAILTRVVSTAEVRGGAR